MIVAQSTVFFLIIFKIFILQETNASGSKLNEKEKMLILDKHNEMRSRLAHGLLMPNSENLFVKNIYKLRWNRRLEKSAQRRANSCQIIFQTSAYREDVNENSFMGINTVVNYSSSQYTRNDELIGRWRKLQSYQLPLMAITFWMQGAIDEFNDNLPLTRMTLPMSTDLGCGINDCFVENSQTSFFVCHYSPGSSDEGPYELEYGRICESNSDCTTYPDSICNAMEGLCSIPFTIKSENLQENNSTLERELEIGREEKNVLLHEHNQYRAELAFGSISGYPIVPHLFDLKWNEVLARRAQKRANECDPKPSLNNFDPKIGENIYGIVLDDPFSIETLAIIAANRWWNRRVTLGGINNFYQMASEHVTELGCGVSLCYHRNKLQNRMYLVCFYNSRVDPNHPMSFSQFESVTITLKSVNRMLGFQREFWAGDEKATNEKCPNSENTLYQRNRILEQHNRYRMMVAQGFALLQKDTLPRLKDIYKLRWNCDLETEAQRVASSCTAMFDDNFEIPEGTGENLFIFETNQTIVRTEFFSRAVEEWWNEVNQKGSKAFKFFQMISSDILEVGCAAEFCNLINESSIYMAVVVCKYFPESGYLKMVAKQESKTCTSTDCRTYTNSSCDNNTSLCIAPDILTFKLPNTDLESDNDFPENHKSLSIETETEDILIEEIQSVTLAEDVSYEKNCSQSRIEPSVKRNILEKYRELRGELAVRTKTISWNCSLEKSAQLRSDSCKLNHSEGNRIKSYGENIQCTESSNGTISFEDFTLKSIKNWWKKNEMIYCNISGNKYESMPMADDYNAENIGCGISFCPIGEHFFHVFVCHYTPT